MDTQSSKAPPEPKFILKKDMNLIHCLNFPYINVEDECKRLYVGTEDGEVIIWDLITLNQILKQKVGNSIQAIHFQGSNIIVQEKEGHIQILRLENGQLNNVHHTITGDASFCKSIILDHLLFTAAEFINVYNITTGEKENSLVLNGLKKMGMIMCLIEVCVEDSKFHIMALYETGDGLIWDSINSTVVDQLLFKPQPLSASFNTTKGRGVVVGASNTIEVFETSHLSAGGSKIIYQIEMPIEGSLTVVKSRPDGRLFVVGSSDGKLRCFSWKTLKLLVVLTEHTHPITDIYFPQQRVSACCKTPLVASSTDGVISFWDVY